MYACMCMYVYVCMYMYACIYMYVYVCMYMYVCMYVCICMCVCMYVYVCVCIHVYWGELSGELSGGMSFPKREGNCLGVKLSGGIVRGELSRGELSYTRTEVHTFLAPWLPSFHPPTN